MRKSQKRNLKSVIYISLLLIVLGIGNIVFASSKLKLYGELYRRLNSVNQELFRDPQTEQVPREKAEKLSAGSEESVSAEAQRLEARIARAKARLDFYKTVSMGGKCLLVTSALLLLYCLYMSKDTSSRLSSGNKDSI